MPARTGIVNLDTSTCHRDIDRQHWLRPHDLHAKRDEQADVKSSAVALRKFGSFNGTRAGHTMRHQPLRFITSVRACWCGIGIREPIRCLGAPPAPGHFPLAPASSRPLRRLSCFRSAISLSVMISALSSACAASMIASIHL